MSLDMFGQWQVRLLLLLLFLVLSCLVLFALYCVVCNRLTDTQPRPSFSLLHVQVDWGHTWEELAEPPQPNPSGLYIPLRHAKKVLGFFTSSESGKLVAIQSQKKCQVLFQVLLDFVYVLEHLVVFQ